LTRLGAELAEALSGLRSWSVKCSKRVDQQPAPLRGKAFERLTSERVSLLAVGFEGE
jgi:hypothetical protein